MSRPIGISIVTGGGQGLGRAFCLALACAGAPVAVADIDPVRAQSVASEIELGGGTALAVEVDVANPEAVREMGERVERELGPPRTLVNNAAIFSSLRVRPFTDITPTEWARVLEVNVTGAFLCCQAVIPGMAERGYGKVINISSATVWSARPGYPHYVTSKAALIGLTRSLAAEVGASGVRVNAITPGSTATEIPRETISNADRAEMARHTALRRIQVPDDLVGTVLFLASPDSDFVTGQTINVDGGLTFH
jgi:3-oxoacyl-[acyl-carrier protein] reductase